MSRHLDDHELASATAGGFLEPEKLAHLEECVSCRRSVKGFLDHVENRRHTMEEEAPNWDDHLAGVLGGLPRAPATPISIRRGWLNPLLAAAATITIAVGAGMFVHRDGPTPVPTPRPEIAIEEILAQTDSLLEEDGIPDFDVFDTITDDDLTALFGAQNS